MLDYVRDGAEIYRQSFATIRAEADLSAFPDDVARVVVRLIHTCGQVDLPGEIAFTPGVVARTRAALDAGARILCDSSMVAAGITRLRLPADNEVVSLVADPRAAELAQRTGTTRSAAAVDLWADRLPGSVAAIGNAPTALFRILELIDEGLAPRCPSGRPRRIRRFGPIQTRTDRPPAWHGVSAGAGPARRQRDGGRCGECDCER